jgi:antitoxin MazE
MALVDAVDQVDKQPPRVYLQCRYWEWRLDMRTRVQKWGNSLALRIPKSFAAEVGLQQEASVEISLADGGLVIRPVAEPKLTLEQLLAGVTRQNLHHEVDTGPAVGKEIW